MADLGVEPVGAQNWVAISQSALPPVAAGRFLVHGSHDRARVRPRWNAIEIEAGEAFGTGHHATTSGCLMAIDRLACRFHPRRILDLGCGAGTLAIAAAQAWPKAMIKASDNDPVAIDVARANARANRAVGRVRFLVARGLDHAELRPARHFDLILANILAGPLIALAPRLRQAIAPDGVIVLSGLLETEARQVRSAYRAAGYHLLSEHRQAGWSVLEVIPA